MPSVRHSPSCKIQEACKPDSVVSCETSYHSSGIAITSDLKRPTQGWHRDNAGVAFDGDSTPYIWPCFGWGLPSELVTKSLVSSYLTVSPLPLSIAAEFGGVFSVALSVGSPRLAVSQHRSL